MIKELFIYKSNGYDPYYNIATEQYLFENLPKDSVILYLWQNSNTVVIGANQNPLAECNTDLMKKDGILLARRYSGGGAVFHDMGNLNFTFIAEKDNYDLTKQLKIIRDACKICGIDAKVSGRNDILADGRKFSGNAFFHSGQKSYHHGTILIAADKEKMTRYLSPSPAKLEAKGIKSVKSRVINLCELNPDIDKDKMVAALITAATKTYGTKSNEFEINDIAKIQKQAEVLCSFEHLYGKSSPFDIQLEQRFDFANIELLLSVKKGIIEQVQVHTDAMDPDIAGKIKQRLCGEKYDKEHIFKIVEQI